MEDVTSFGTRCSPNNCPRNRKTLTRNLPHNPTKKKCERFWTLPRRVLGKQRTAISTCGQQLRKIPLSTVCSSLFSEIWFCLGSARFFLAPHWRLQKRRSRQRKQVSVRLSAPWPGPEKGKQVVIASAGDSRNANRQHQESKIHRNTCLVRES